MENKHFLCILDYNEGSNRMLWVQIKFTFFVKSALLG